MKSPHGLRLYLPIYTLIYRETAELIILKLFSGVLRQSRCRVSFRILRSLGLGALSHTKVPLAVSLESLGISPERRPYEHPTGTYLERSCVHVCTQLYTRGYTDVYTHVHFSLLGSRYTLGKFAPREQILLSWVYPPRLLCPRPLVILYLSTWERVGERTF